METGPVIQKNDARILTTSKSTEAVMAPPPGSHKRSLSGSILFPLFGEIQSRQDASKPTSRAKPVVADPPATPRVPGGAAIASAMRQELRARKRKGSLRKTALLGRGKTRLEEGDEDALGAETDTTTTQLSREKSVQSTSNGQAAPPPKTTHVLPPRILPRSENHMIEPLPFTRKDSTASTTDEDDLSSPGLSLAPGQDSYFPPHPRPYRARPPALKSPLGSLPVSIPSPPQEWDYSETRAWGWVLLAATWIVFVVGMGSCFGVWSWAWDVGETPYAPPELEDDPTLPIVGYYPALIILTGVMAWVWVVVAWVGMKYFRHAKISGEGV